jgi:hypothetical protein
MITSWSGRRSGRRFSIPVGYQADGDAIVVMLSKRDEKTWWMNFRTPWPADLEIRGQRRTAMGEVIPVGSADFFEQCERTLRRMPWMGSQFGGIRYDAEAGLSDAQRTILCEQVGAVRFELTD